MISRICKGLLMTLLFKPEILWPSFGGYWEFQDFGSLLKKGYVDTSVNRKKQVYACFFINHHPQAHQLRERIFGRWLQGLIPQYLNRRHRQKSRRYLRRNPDDS